MSLEIPQIAGTLVFLDGNKIKYGPIVRGKNSPAGQGWQETTCGYYVRYVNGHPEEQHHPDLVDALLDVVARIEIYRQSRNKGSKKLCRRLKALQRMHRKHARDRRNKMRSWEKRSPAFVTGTRGPSVLRID